MNSHSAGRTGQPTLTEWWSALTPPRRGATLALLALEVTLTTRALLDLARRPSAEVRGPKALWLLACAVQPVGPIAYLTLGRNRNRAHDAGIA